MRSGSKLVACLGAVAGTLSNTCDTYDLQAPAGGWTAGASFPEERQGFASAQLSKDEFWVGSKFDDSVCFLQ